MWMKTQKKQKISKTIVVKLLLMKQIGISSFMHYSSFLYQATSTSSTIYQIWNFVCRSIFFVGCEVKCCILAWYILHNFLPTSSPHLGLQMLLSELKLRHSRIHIHIESRSCWKKFFEKGLCLPLSLQAVVDKIAEIFYL